MNATSTSVANSVTSCEYWATPRECVTTAIES